MNLNNLNPFIRYAKLHTYYSPINQNSVCYDCRLFYILHGDGNIIANEISYDITNDTLIYLPPKTKYRFAFNDNMSTKIYVINFDLVDSFSHISSSFGLSVEKKFNSALSPQYELLPEFTNPIVRPNQILRKSNFSKCIEMFLHKDPLYRQISSALIKLVLLELLKTEDTSHKLAQEVIQYIQSEYASPELDNKTISEHFHYHPYHLNRLIKSYLNTSLHGYLIDYRLHIAKDLLLSSNLSVTEIAEKVGFSSYAYFIKKFKEKNHTPPMKYRQKSRML